MKRSIVSLCLGLSLIAPSLARADDSAQKLANAKAALSTDQSQVSNLQEDASTLRIAGYSHDALALCTFASLGTLIAGKITKIPLLTKRSVVALLGCGIPDFVSGAVVNNKSSEISSELLQKQQAVAQDQSQVDLLSKAQASAAGASLLR